MSELGLLELPSALQDELRASWHRYLDLVAPIRPALHGYCRRLTRDLWDAEDLVQDTLERGFGTLGKVHDPVQNPRAYLLRTATHLWIDRLRRRSFESAALEGADAPQGPRTPHPGELRDASRVLLESLAPRERAAILLKEVFDMSLEESAEVLETTVGAVKAALHRARGRLKDEKKAAPRSHPSPRLVDRFVELFNAEDKPGLLELVLDNATVENVGVGYEWTAEQHRSSKSWFNGALGGHPEWPSEWRYEAQRAEHIEFEGEPMIALIRTRRGREAMETVVRLDEYEGQVSRLRSYSFSPETVREVAQAVGMKARTGPYRYPTVAPGVPHPSHPDVSRPGQNESKPQEKESKP